MTVHHFGEVSSPSCSNFALRKTASENEAEFGMAAAEMMHRNFYVDDCIKLVSNKAEATDLIRCLHQACGKGGQTANRKRNSLNSLFYLQPPRVRCTICISREETSSTPLQRGEAWMDDQPPDCYLRRWEKWRNELK